MSQSLFLVKGRVSVSEYMGETTIFEDTQLVWADFYIDAEKKFQKYWNEKSLSYSTRYFVLDVTASEAIS